VRKIKGELKNENTFNIFHPYWMKWADRIAQELRYDTEADSLTVQHVMGKLIDLGFTLYPPDKDPSKE